MTVAEHVAVPALQGRAGDDDVASCLLVLADPGGQAAQPRPAVVVVQRDPGPHLLDVGGRVEVVALGELPAQAVDEGGGDGRLAGAADAHDDDRGRGRWAGSRHHQKVAATLDPHHSMPASGRRRPGVPIRYPQGTQWPSTTRHRGVAMSDSPATVGTLMRPATTTVEPDAHVASAA